MEQEWEEVFRLSTSANPCSSPFDHQNPQRESFGCLSLGVEWATDQVGRGVDWPVGQVDRGEQSKSRTFDWVENSFGSESDLLDRTSALSRVELVNTSERLASLRHLKFTKRQAELHQSRYFLSDESFTCQPSLAPTRSSWRFAGVSKTNGGQTTSYKEVIRKL